MDSDIQPGLKIYEVMGGSNTQQPLPHPRYRDAQCTHVSPQPRRQARTAAGQEALTCGGRGYAWWWVPFHHDPLGTREPSLEIIWPGIQGGEKHPRGLGDWSDMFANNRCDG